MLNTWHVLQIRTHMGTQESNLAFSYVMCASLTLLQPLPVLANSILCAAFWYKDGVEGKRPTGVKVSG